MFYYLIITPGGRVFFSEVESGARRGSVKGGGGG